MKPSAKNRGSNNWVLIQGAIFTILIVISGLLSLPSCYWRMKWAKKLKTKNGSFAHDAAHIILFGIFPVRTFRKYGGSAT